MKIIEAIQKIYPTIQSGFIYWETQQDLTPWENPIDCLIWENAEFEKPTWEQIQQELNIIELEEAKTSKITQLKTNRNLAMEVEIPKTGSTHSYEIDGVLRTFKLKIADLAILNGRINRLKDLPSSTTAQWTDIDGNRLNLTLVQFQSLASHLDVRDQDLYTFYLQTKEEINACTTLEELNAINIDF